MTRRALLACLLSLGVAGCERPATKLEFRARDEGRRLRVVGTTSLPDQAPLVIWLQKTPIDPPLVEGMALVQNQRFMATLLVPPTLAEGPYVVRVAISPRLRSWSPTVQEALGAHGEALEGPLVHKDAEGNHVLELTEQTWIGPPGV